MYQTSFSALTPLQKNLLEKASEVMETAYNPYSNFFVGAALHSLPSEIITGSNFENAAYGSTICAERSAVLRANAMGLRSFDKVAIIGRGKEYNSLEVVSPCGSCRQVLYEVSQISKMDLEIIMSSSKKDKIIVATIEELLPLAFGPLNLGLGEKK